MKRGHYGSMRKGIAVCCLEDLHDWSANEAEVENGEVHSWASGRAGQQASSKRDLQSYNQRGAHQVKCIKFSGILLRETGWLVFCYENTQKNRIPSQGDVDDIDEGF